MKTKRLRDNVIFKSISGLVLLLVVFCVLVCVIGYYVFTNALLEQYAEDAFGTANTAALVLDADELEVYAQGDGTSEGYLRTLENMDKLCDATGSTFIYVILPDRTDYAHIVFLFSAAKSDIPYTRYDFGYVRETTNEEYRQKYRAICEYDSPHELVVRDKGHIETDKHITAMIPLKGSDQTVKAILCVQRQMDGMSYARKKYIGNVILLMIALAVIVAISDSFYLNKVLLVPVKTIMKEASRFAEENTPAERKLTEKIQIHDEIGLLAGAIDQMEDQVQAYIENLTKITAERERISTELDLAANIQLSMMPGTFPAFPDRTDFDIRARMRPAKTVGGDFYDFFLIDEEHLCVLMADVSGKGIPAALFMMASRIILANSLKLGKSPAAALAAANETICANNPMEMFVTVWVGMLDLKTGKMAAANAGHEDPAIRRTNGCFEIMKEKHDFVVGALSGVSYREFEFTMEVGDRLFLYTDGIPEAAGSSHEMFGNQRMLDALNFRPDAPQKELLGYVESAVDAFVGDAEQFDDLTMLCLDYRG